LLIDLLICFIDRLWRKKNLLNSIFDTLIEDLKSEKDDLILSVEKMNTILKSAKTAQEFKKIVAYMFLWQF
jgi:hypothetical protein